MLKAKRYLSLVVVMLFVVSIALTGCGTANNNTTTAGTDATTKPAETTEAKKDPVTIIWYNGGDDQAKADPVYKKVNEILLERYNILLDFRTIPFGTYDEKINMIISSNENYDLCLTTQSWLNKYPVQVSKGAFLALDDYLPKYPVLTESLPAFLFEQARENGKIYAIPNYQITYSQIGLLFRKDLLDESGFDITKVKTYMDAEPFWQFVKEKHPELYPTKITYSAELEDVDHTYVSVSNDAIFKKDDPNFKVTMMDGKEESMATKRGAWYTSTRNRNLWLKGYLRKDSATVQDDSADLSAGKYATIPGTVKPGGDAESKAKYGYDYVSVGIEKPFTTSVAARATMTAVNALSKNPEEALRMLEITNTDKEIYNMINFGIQDVNYTLKGGKVEVIPDSGYFYNNAWTVGNQFNALLMTNQQDGIWEETDKINREAEVTPLTGFTFVNTNVKNQIANISAVGKEFGKWEFQDDYETRYDDRVAKLNAAGRNDVLVEMQKQIDEWRKVNNR